MNLPPGSEFRSPSYACSVTPGSAITLCPPIVNTEDLSFPRKKHRSLFRSAAHRSQPLLRRILGLDRTLRLLLNTERVAWRLAFEAAGEKYGEDFYNRSLALKPERLGQWIPAGSSVLDVGCGTGRLTRLVAPSAERVLGIDRDADALRIAEGRTHTPGVSFRLGDAADLPTDRRFDVALLSHVLEHIDAPVKLLRELSGIAELLIVEVPAFDSSVLNPLRLELGVDFASDDDHVREYTEELLAEQFAAANWQPVTWCRSPTSIAAMARVKSA